MRHADGEHLRWPCERFFWSVLDAPGLKLTGPLPESLLDEVADDLPVPIEDVHVVAASTGGGLVVCAARRSDLDQLQGAPRSLVPDRLPRAVKLGVEPERFNLLVGSYEPRAARAERTRGHLVKAAVLVLLAGLVTLGLERRAREWNRIALEARAAAESLARDVVPDQSPAVLDLALDGELARLRRARQTSALVAAPVDATLCLAGLLNAWPSGIATKPQSIAVTSAGVSVSVVVDGDASPFLTAFKPPRGWTLDEPRINASGNITRLSLQMRPAVPVASGPPKAAAPPVPGSPAP